MFYANYLFLFICHRLGRRHDDHETWRTCETAHDCRLWLRFFGIPCLGVRTSAPLFVLLSLPLSSSFRRRRCCCCCCCCCCFVVVGVVALLRCCFVPKL